MRNQRGEPVSGEWNNRPVPETLLGQNNRTLAATRTTEYSGSSKENAKFCRRAAARAACGFTARLRSSQRNGSIRGVFARRVQSSRDQLERADDGSWKIADGGDTRTARADVTSVDNFRVRLAVEPLLVPQLCMALGGAVPTTRSCVLVPALLPQSTWSIC